MLFQWLITNKAIFIFLIISVLLIFQRRVVTIVPIPLQLKRNPKNFLFVEILGVQLLKMRLPHGYRGVVFGNRMRVGQVRGVESGPLLVMLKNLGFVLLQLAQNSCVVAVFSEPVSD
jgi:hypothetical protein